MRQARRSIPTCNGNEKSTKYVQPRKTTLRIVHLNKNINVIINDTDKILGLACADKDDVINGSKRQLYVKRVYNQLTQEKAEQLIRVIKKVPSNCRQTHSGWVQLDTFSRFNIVWTLFERIMCQVRFYFNEAVVSLKFLEKEKFDPDVFLLL